MGLDGREECLKRAVHHMVAIHIVGRMEETGKGQESLRRRAPSGLPRFYLLSSNF